ncbi:MAG: hypothetical protein PQ971_06730 [Methanobacterium sp.]
MKNVQKGVVLILSIAVLFLTFCSVVTAHPGHGTKYPDELILQDQIHHRIKVQY